MIATLQKRQRAGEVLPAATILELTMEPELLVLGLSGFQQHKRPHRKSNLALAPFQPSPTPPGALPTPCPHAVSAHTFTLASPGPEISLETALVLAGPRERPKVM